MNTDVQHASISIKDNGLSSISAASPFDDDSWEILRESVDLLAKVLKPGRVRGIVNIVGLPDVGGKDGLRYEQLIQGLIRLDILVTISSCEAVGISKAGMAGADFFQSAGDGLVEFCNFIGIQPVIYIESTIDKSHILDFYNEVAQQAAVETLNLPTAAIVSGRYQGRTESPGDIFTMDDNPVETADLVNKHIHDKRLEIRWCDRFDCRYSNFS